jgi:hypothetical protein
VSLILRVDAHEVRVDLVPQTSRCHDSRLALTREEIKDSGFVSRENTGQV